MRCVCVKMGGGGVNEDTGWHGKPGGGWQKDKKGPSQKSHTPPPCTLETYSTIILVPDGPTHAPPSCVSV